MARIEYRTRVVDFGRTNLGGDDAELHKAIRPDGGAVDQEWWEIFSIQPLGDDQYRLFMKRAVRDR